MSDYGEKLKNPRWQKKRLEILNRDGWACQICQEDERQLHVHHIRYLKDCEPWEYPDEFLITLCDGCHDLEHSKDFSEYLLRGVLKTAKDKGIFRLEVFLAITDLLALSKNRKDFLRLLSCLGYKIADDWSKNNE